MTVQGARPSSLTGEYSTDHLSDIKDHTYASVEDDDAPDTPAPLFAINAFKHALFGTPKPGNTEHKPQRRDLHPASRSSIPTKHANSPSQIPRRRTHGTGPQLALRPASTVASPARGILLTPGTARRQKSVSFGAAARGRATPKDVPGRYPSPWVTKDGHIEDAGGAQPGNAGPAKSLELDHDSLSTRFMRLTTSKSTTLAPTGQETVAPRGESDAWPDNRPSTDEPDVGAGNTIVCWRTYHERYAAKSTLEMRKLVKREQIARKFAKHKDREAMKLREALTVEKQKVEELGRQLQESMRLHGTEAGNISKPPRDDPSRGPPEHERDDVFLQLKGEVQPPSHARHNKQPGDELPADKSRRRASYASIPASLHETKTLPTAAVRGAHKRAGVAEVVSSDIWADAAIGGTEEEEVALAGRPRRRASASTNSRKPLTASVGLGNAGLESREHQSVVQEMAADEENKDDCCVDVAEPVGVKMAASAKLGQSDSNDAGGSGMSEVRREAARKRLEERRRLRALQQEAGGTGAR